MMNLMWSFSDFWKGFLENFSKMADEGLPIMVAGMLGIFVVIGIIILVVWLLSKIPSGDSYLGRGIKELFSRKK